MQKNKMPVPTEAQEQMTLFSWAAMQSGKYPELNLLYHVPNGGSRHKAEAGRLRAEGVKAGVPDLCLPVARGQYYGPYIELKRQRGGRTSDHQSEWLDALSAQGYKAALCYGWEQAAGTIIEYLTGGGTHDDKANRAFLRVSGSRIRSRVRRGGGSIHTEHVVRKLLQGNGNVAV